MLKMVKFQAANFLSILCFFLFPIDPAIAQVDQPARFETSDEIQKLLDENKIPALGIGVISGGKLTQVKVFGELKKGETAPFNTIFNVASLTKPVAALLTLKLASLGRLNLDEPLDKYWVDPDIKNDPRRKKLTARLILSHRTGFPNWRWLNKSNKLEFSFEPGTGYQYSGEGFEYLKKALEKKFGKPLEKLAEELIFKPLEMRDTQFFWDARTAEARFAVGGDKEGKPYEIKKNTTASAADDLLTTVEDYGKFLIWVMNGAGLSKEIFDEMISHQVKRKENKYFGLGWEIYDLGAGEYVLTHGGGDPGVNTLVFLLPNSKQGLIIFTSGDNGHQIYLKLIGEYLKDFGKRMIEIEMKSN